MNIKTDKAGVVSHEHIISKGFTVFETTEGSGMCGESWSIPQYTNGKIYIMGGYWTWYIRKTPQGDDLFDGWWNTNEEFDNTLEQINAQLK
jgi:hypothetical protein